MAGTGIGLHPGQTSHGALVINAYRSHTLKPEYRCKPNPSPYRFGPSEHFACSCC